MPLHIDYRPDSFENMFGNKATLASLKAIYGRESDWPHAILLQGPKGTGKTTIARIIKGLLDCHGTDFTEINSSNDRGIAVARKISDESKYKPLYGKTRVYLLDEVHQTTKDFQNALLKPLEDCQHHVYYILCTTDPSNLIAALRSRCHTFETQNLNRSEGIGLLKYVLKKENVDWVPDNIIKKICDVSEGCPRDSLKILDQIIDIQSDEEMEAAIQSFNYEQSQVNELWSALLKGQNWTKVRNILKNMDLTDHERLRRAMLGCMATVIMKEENNTAALIFDCFKDPFYNTGKAGFVNACYRAVIEIN